MHIVKCTLCTLWSAQTLKLLLLVGWVEPSLFSALKALVDYFQSFVPRALLWSILITFHHWPDKDLKLRPKKQLQALLISTPFSSKVGLLAAYKLNKIPWPQKADVAPAPAPPPKDYRWEAKKVKVKFKPQKRLKKVKVKFKPQKRLKK